MRKLALFILAVSLAGCGQQQPQPITLAQPQQPQPQQAATPSPPKYWMKPDYTQVAFNSDRYQCLQSSIAQSQPNNSVVIPDATSSQLLIINQMNNQNILFSACMEAKGYTFQAVTTTPPPVQSDKPKISNMKVAYCLGVAQSSLKAWSDILQKDQGTKNAKIDENIVSDDNNIKQTLTTYLTNTYGANFPFDISAAIENGHEDWAKEEKRGRTRIDKYSNCISSCDVGSSEFYTCWNKCDQYQSGRRRKIMDCIQVENDVLTSRN